MYNVFCYGNNPSFCSIARALGFEIGAQLPAKSDESLFFCDNSLYLAGEDEDYKEAYFADLRKHKPHLAVVLDWQVESQFKEVIAWAQEASEVVEKVIVVPKVRGGVHRIPEEVGGKEVVLGYSVPTRYSKTSVPPAEFSGRRVHLLGGAPHKQMRLWRQFNEYGCEVYSVDGNMIAKMANKRSLYWSAVKGKKGHFRSVKGMSLPDNANTVAFSLSCSEVQSAWRAMFSERGIRQIVSEFTVTYGSEEDVKAVRAIASRHDYVLGYTSPVAYRESAQKMSLLVARNLSWEVVGYLRFRKKKNRPRHLVVYEICIDYDYKRMGVGSRLLDVAEELAHENDKLIGVKAKCPVNAASNKFYESRLYVLTGSDDKTNIWEKRKEGHDGK